MPTTVITTKATFQPKLGAGVLQHLFVTSPGTTWTLQINDGPIGATNSVTSLIGATPITVPAAGTLLILNLPFSNGLQIVTAGTTAGELEVTWA